MTTPKPIEPEIVHIALGYSPRPPVDLDHIAKVLGASVLETTFRDGYTDFSQSHPNIYLNPSGPETRRRFIFAHELAHVMLRMPQVLRHMERRGRFWLLWNEEQLADYIAATLLVPQSWIEELPCRWIEELRHQRTPLRQLPDVAKEAKVSLATLIGRLTASGFDVALLHWRQERSTWHLIDRPGAPPVLLGPVKPSPVGVRTLENLNCTEMNIVVDCRVSGWHVRIRGLAFREGVDLQLLIQPSRDVRILGKESPSPRTPGLAQSAQVRALPCLTAADQPHAHEPARKTDHLAYS